MAWQIITVFIVALLSAMCAWVLHPRFWEGAATPFGIALAVVMLLVYGSSLIDWYYTRPGLDGVVRRPPCQTSKDEYWGKLTRQWFTHRWLCYLGTVLVSGAALVLFSAWLLIWIIPEGDGSWRVLAPVGSVALIVVGALLKDKDFWVAFQYVWNAPTFAIGDHMSVNSGVRGFLRDVSVKGVTIVQRRASGEWDVRFVSLHDLSQLGYTATKRSPCAKQCERYNRVRPPGDSEKDDLASCECQWDEELFNTRGPKTHAGLVI